MLFVIFASLFGLLAAAPMDGMMSMGNATRGCCMPNKFSATMVQLGAALPPNSMTPAITDAYSVIDFDYDMKMMRMQMHQLDQNSGMMTMMDVFIDYKAMKTYSVVAGQCYVVPMTETMTQPCIAANATYMGSAKLGSGANMVMVDRWMMMSMGMRTMFMVQSDTCTLVTMQQYGDAKDGSKELNSFTFADVKKGEYSTMDVNPFVLPDACKNPVMPPVGK